MRTRILATLTVTAALTISTVTTASAAVPSGDNVLRGFCSNITGTLTTSCVADASDDFRTFAVRDRRGRLHKLPTTAKALRYLRHHATPCKQEDSPRCFWDAGHRGNHYGDSFIVIGGKRAGQGTVAYFEDITR